MVLSVLPVILPPMVMNAHICTRTVWNCVLMLESMNAHCGYHFPYLPDARAHDFHHSHPHKAANFGSFFLVWDKLFGTDLYYKEHLLLVERKNTEISDNKVKEENKIKESESDNKLDGEKNDKVIEKETDEKNANNNQNEFDSEMNEKELDSEEFEKEFEKVINRPLRRSS